MNEPKAQRPAPPAVVDFTREHEGLLLVYRSDGVTAMEGLQSRGRRELVHALIGYATLGTYGVVLLVLRASWVLAVPALLVGVGFGTWKLLRAVRHYREMWFTAEIRAAQRPQQGGP